MPRQDEFGLPLDRHKAIGIAAVGALLIIVPLFTPDEALDLIALHILNLNAVNFGLQQPFTMSTGMHEHTEDRIPVQIGQPLDTSDGHAFHHDPQD
jgi:hypothetical protein